MIPSVLVTDKLLKISTIQTDPFTAYIAVSTSSLTNQLTNKALPLSKEFPFSSIV